MKIREILNEVGDYYAPMPEQSHNPDPYPAKKIVWYGFSGKMIKMTKQNSEPMWGNIFHPEKIRKTADAIRYSEDSVKFNAPRVSVSIIDLNWVRSSIIDAQRGDAMFDPVINDCHQYTTGDDELDKYIIDKKQYLDDNSYGDDIAEMQAEMESRLQEAIDTKSGDIGSLHIQVRDGNHRRAAAFASGEPFVWGYVTDVHIDPEIQQYLK